MSVDARMMRSEIRERIFGAPEHPRVGRFELRSRLGRGSHGAVYLAEDKKLGRLVAVKVLDTVETDSSGRSRLAREAQTLARLSHPNVLQVHDIGVDAGNVFIAMEYVQEGTLADWCAAHLPESAGRFAELLELGIGAALGIAAAHTEGIVHRDVKPANILIGDDGRPRVADFGLAKPPMRSDTHSGATPTGETDPHSTLTETHAIVGTPAYMAPEQFSGHGDEASDQFSLCVTLWEAAYGERPFEADDLDGLIAAVRQPPRAPTQRRDVPAWFTELLRRGLSNDPRLRWPSVAALAAELQRRRDASSRKGGRGRYVVIGLFAIVAAGAIGYREVTRRAAVRACDREASQVAEVWPGRADPARQGILATPLPYAERVADGIGPWYDGWAQRWEAAQGEVCHRSTIEGSMPPEIAQAAQACLDLERARVDQQLDGLEASERQRVSAAVVDAASLQDPTRCIDRSKLDQVAWPDDDRRADVLELRKRAVGNISAVGAGIDGAVQEARAILADAQSVGFEPMVAEARLNLGSALRLTEREEAEALLHQAYLDAIRLDLPSLAAKSAILLQMFVVSNAGRPREGLEWSEHAETWVDRLGEREGVLGARLESARAVAYEAQGDYKTGLEHRERALAIYESIVGTQHPDVARSLLKIGIAHARLGDIDRALERLESALEIRRAVLGDEHPLTIEGRTVLASARGMNGEVDEAIRLLEQSRRDFEAVYGPMHAQSIGTLQDLATVKLMRGDYEEGVRLLEVVYERQQEQLGPDHPQALLTRHNIAAALLEMDRTADALAVLRDLVARSEKSKGPDHPDLGDSLQMLGGALLQLDRREEAIAALERSVAIFERARSSGPPGKEFLLLGQAYQTAGRYGDAEAILTRALLLAAATRREEDRFLSNIRLQLAKLAAERGRTHEATQILDHALAVPGLPSFDPASFKEMTTLRGGLAAKTGR